MMLGLVFSLDPEIDLTEESMTVYPLREMQEFWDMREELLQKALAIYWSADRPGIAALAEQMIEKIKSISPPNKENSDG